MRRGAVDMDFILTDRLGLFFMSGGFGFGFVFVFVFVFVGVGVCMR